MMQTTIRGGARRGATLATALLLAGAAMPAAAIGCDLCAIYTATEMRESRTGFELGVAEQFTRFTTLKEEGEEIANPAHERMESSITQLLLGYNVSAKLGVQLTLPIVTRSFRRALEDGIDRGHESGLGDLSLLLRARPYTRVTEHGVFRLALLGGLKLPSGDSDRLGEEAAEHEDGGHADDDHDEAAAPAGAGDGGRTGFHDAHAGHDDGTPSGIHGHDLALGSGSVDGIVGGQAFWSWRRVFATAGVQYAIRSKGDFDYRYANDLLWSGGPGAFVLLGHPHTLAVQALVSGERKAKDTLDGRAVGDTAITAVYLGPALTYTWGTSLGVEVAADLPVVQDNTGVQIVADYRLRGGVAWRF